LIIPFVSIAADTADVKERLAGMKTVLLMGSVWGEKGRVPWVGWILGSLVLLALVPVLGFHPAPLKLNANRLKRQALHQVNAVKTDGDADSAAQSTAAAIRKLSKRPARLPPPDVALKRCLAALSDEDEGSEASGDIYTDLGFVGLDDTRTATNMLFAESRREVLLGECKCPLKLPHPDAEWSFDCAEWDYKILSELAPWWNVNITHSLLDFVATYVTTDAPLDSVPSHRFSVVDGQPYWNVNPGVKLAAYHRQLMSMMDTFSKTVELPNVEFLLSTWDWGSVPRQEPAPIFLTSKDAGRLDVVIPTPYSWSTSIGDFDIEWKGGCKDKPWEERDPRVAARLACSGPVGYKPLFYHSYLRARATELTHQYPDLLNVGLTQVCTSELAATAGELERQAGKPLPSALPSMDHFQSACEDQSLLLLDGNTYPGRSTRYFNSGSTIFKPDSIFSEWYFHLLRPWIHYVPVREFLEDLPEVAAYMRENKALGKCIAENGKKFAKRYLNKWTASCYMWRLLSAWSSQQPEGSRILEGMMTTDDPFGVKERGGVHTADSPVDPIIKQLWEDHLGDVAAEALGSSNDNQRGGDGDGGKTRAEDALEQLDREAGY
jgi:Glycosyl transferase family 90